MMLLSKSSTIFFFQYYNIDNPSTFFNSICNRFFKQEEFKLYYVGDIGIQNGLTVTMDPLLDDYFYTILPTIGWKVIIYRLFILYYFYISISIYHIYHISCFCNY